MPELERPGDVTLHYETAGDPETPPVVLLHGFTSDLRMWAPLVPVLARRYFVVSLDLRGHGLSTAPANPEAATMDDFADDVLALFDALEIELGVLAGCSFGGMIAAHFGVNWPGRLAGLVLSDTSAAYDHPAYDDAYRNREAQLVHSEEVVRNHGTAELGKRAAARITDPFLASALRDRYARMSGEGYLAASRVRRERPDVLPMLAERLTMPVLICTGSRDPVNSASLVMAEQLPEARVVTFNGAGHGLPAVAPEKFEDVLLTFLADIEAGHLIAGRYNV
jgi:pimeloyl-ACP methyl ester carboxylesterase